MGIGDRIGIPALGYGSYGRTKINQLYQTEHHSINLSIVFLLFLEPFEVLLSCSCGSYLITDHRRSIAASPSFQNKMNGSQPSVPLEASAEMSNVECHGARFVP